MLQGGHLDHLKYAYGKLAMFIHMVSIVISSGFAGNSARLLVFQSRMIYFMSRSQLIYS